MPKPTLLLSHCNVLRGSVLPQHGKVQDYAHAMRFDRPALAAAKLIDPHAGGGVAIAI
jgi:hypothetical protein